MLDEGEQGEEELTETPAEGEGEAATEEATEGETQAATDAETTDLQPTGLENEFKTVKGSLGVLLPSAT